MKELSDIFNCVPEVDDRSMCVVWGFLFTANKRRIWVFSVTTFKAVAVVVLSSRLQFMPLAFQGKRMGWMTS